MKDKLQDLYEMLGGACVMAFLYLYLFGFQPALLLILGSSILLYWVSAYKKSVLLYLLCSVFLICLIPRAGSDVVEKIALGVGVGIGIIGYFVGRWKGNPGLFAGISYWYLMIAGIGYFLGVLRTNDLWKEHSCFYAAALVAICMLNNNQKSVQAYIKANEKLHRFPKNRLWAKNQAAIFVLTFLVLGGMIAGYVAAPEVSFELKPVEVDLTPTAVEVQTEAMQDMDLSVLTGGEVKSPPAWLVALGDMLYKLCMVGVAVFLVGLVIVGIYLLVKGYQKRFVPVEEAAASTEEDEIEKVMPRGGALKRFFERKSPGEMIRKYYKKWIRSALKIVPGTAAPMELEIQAGLSDEEFHNLYEKARYSQKDCTKEESLQVKQKIR